VLAELRAEPALNGTPVAILTTSESEEDICGCYTSGRCRYFVKAEGFHRREVEDRAVRTPGQRQRGDDLAVKKNIPARMPSDHLGFVLLARRGRHEVRRKLCTADRATKGESHYGTTSRQPNGGFIGAGSGCPSHTTLTFGALEGALKHLALPANLHLVFPA